MAIINVRIIEEDGVVVMQGLEFPGIIVQGKTEQEAFEKFDDSLDHLLRVRAKLATEKYPLTNRETTRAIRVEMAYNG